ncbi:tRNA (guanine(46)-N(7))-methyltransferase TrmB [Kordiimonas sediminis]|uniref:tRNA (guanine(46)-N(7))-methyltransferase TrmB n=1 Tax=Kordiimonas sediminis TaxID=1735581 RepID=UPI001E3A789C|nr:hypothetical protein [Kordiimonas sediminis]
MQTPSYMQTPSRPVLSNQADIHESLDKTVLRHLTSENLRPIADHSLKAFDQAIGFLQTAPERPWILDACCGVGDSTRALARQFPDHLVLGVDKSIKRLQTERQDPEPGNMLLLRTDLNDFYRLAASHGLRPDRHYILYPNPWPKAAHLKRRWHGAPVFPAIVAVGGIMELRSNWDVYLREFARALELADVKSVIEPYEATDPITPFERKYRDSGQPLWRLKVHP